MSNIFEVMQHLRDLNQLRSINWTIADGELVVRIPVSTGDAQFIEDLQRLLG